VIRVAALLGLLTTPAHAWTFTPGSPCLLTHTTDSAQIKLTYDPALPLYTLSITRTAPFAPAPLFAVQFQGANPIAISTDRHTLTNDNRTITVTDSGFGNVLNGLQFNFTAIATLGDQTVEIPLIGAADPVTDFRACDVQAPSV